ncbi:MAG: hypothetical protein ACUVWX_10500 [Kiritimatiellia bacterium]
MGKPFFANYYVDPTAALSWNAGVGHLYHGIATTQADITVQILMLKAGLTVAVPRWSLRFDPYIGYAWEQSEVQSVPQSTSTTTASLLYGLTANRRRHGLELGVNYYYQDNLSGDKGYDVLRVRNVLMLTRSWGLLVRLDRMEHRGSSDTSILAGPVFIW